MSVQQAAWGEVLSDLRKQVGDADYDLWLSGLRLLRVEDNVAMVAAPSRYLCSVVEKKFGTALRALMADRLLFEGDLRFTPDPDGARTALTATRPDGDEARPATRHRNPHQTFANFIAGDSNELAFEACRHVAEYEDDLYNPLVLYGPSGWGKTHLLQAIAHRLVERRRLGVLLITGESFMHQYRQALQQRRIHDFRERVRNVPALLIDDVQALQNKRMAQQELFYTIDDLLKRGSRVVLAGSKPPRDLAGIGTALGNRLAAGLGVRVQPPSLETKLALLRHKLRKAGLHLDQEIQMAVVTRLRGSARDLEGFVARLDAWSRLTGDPVGAREFDMLLREFTAPELRARPTLDSVIAVVQSQWRLEPDALLSPRRARSVTEARQAAFYLARRLCGLSSKEIGERCGGRSHSAVLSAEKAVKLRMETDTEFQHLMHKLMDRVQRAE